MRKALLVPLLLLLSCLTGLVGVMANATPAHADDDTPDSWRITKYHLNAEALPDGQLKVVLDFDFDFARDEGHGPYITLPNHQEITDDPNHWRDLDYSRIEVSSPSGAPTDIDQRNDSGSTVLRIGDSGTDLTGVQSYRVSYVAKGIINPAGADHPDTDEVNWNAVGPAWQVPIDNVEVTIEAPTASERLACFTGKKFTDPCSAEPDRLGNRATFTDDGVDAEEGVQVVAAYPAGTFPGASIVTSHRGTFANFFAANPASIGVGLVGLLGSLGIARWLSRRGRDEHYVGVAPGQLPPRNSRDKVSTDPVREFAVQFTPPSGLRPAETGVLLNKQAANSDVTAAIVDLAVRGHLRIVEVPADPAATKRRDRKPDWRIDLLNRPQSPAAWESPLLAAMFDNGTSVTLTELKDKEFGKAVGTAKANLNHRATTGTKWFRSNPLYGSGPAILIACGLLIAAVIAGAAGAATAPGWAYGCLGLVAGGVVVAIAARHGAGRTPEGFALYAQTRGFEKYLSTAEADQLRFEEGVDIFSRYLPWAISFGVAERWTRLFEELAARGANVTDPGWYVGSHPAVFSSSMGSFADSLAGFEAATSSSITSATSSASGGGSGFSGGGGVGGGGGGGW